MTSDDEKIGERYASLLPHVSIGVLLVRNPVDVLALSNGLPLLRRDDYALVTMQARHAYARTAGAAETLISTHTFKCIIDYLLTGSLNHK